MAHGWCGLKIGEVQSLVHATAREKGWHDKCDPESVTQQLAWLALVHTEVSEAAECVREGALQNVTGPHGKPEGLPSEMADIVIRVMDVCGAMGIDLESAILEKVQHNKTRQIMHGGKLA